MNNLSAILLAFNWSFLFQKLILIVIIVSVSLVIAMYETYLERKIAAWMQDRKGPNRAGPFGILQPLADGTKLFFKEEIIPNTSNKVLFVLGPGLAMLAALMTCAVIPWGNVLQLGDTKVPLANCGCKHWYFVRIWRGELGRVWHYDWRLGEQQ